VRQDPRNIPIFCQNIPALNTCERRADMIEKGLEYAVQSEGGYASNEALYMLYYLSEIVPEIQDELRADVAVAMKNGLIHVIDTMDMKCIESGLSTSPDFVRHFANMKDHMSRVKDDLGMP